MAKNTMTTVTAEQITDWMIGDIKDGVKDNKGYPVSGIYTLMDDGEGNKITLQLAKEFSGHGNDEFLLSLEDNIFYSSIEISVYNGFSRENILEQVGAIMQDVASREEEYTQLPEDFQKHF